MKTSVLKVQDRKLQQTDISVSAQGLAQSGPFFCRSEGVAVERLSFLLKSGAPGVTKWRFVQTSSQSAAGVSTGCPVITM